MKMRSYGALMDIDADESTVIEKPKAVRIASYLLVAPAVLSWAAPFFAAAQEPWLAIPALVGLVLTLYGLLAVSLTWRGGQTAAVTGSLIMAGYGIAFADRNPFGVLAVPFALAVIVLLLLPSSRAWFRAV